MKYLNKNSAPGEDRTRGLSLTKRTQYHYATEAAASHFSYASNPCFTSSQQHSGGIGGLRAEDVSPRLAFHYGVPADAALLAYDPLLHVLAVATRNGQIKLLGRDNTQALLQSPSPIPSKFMQFADGQGVLLSVNTQNQIEVWDIDTKRLCYLHPFEKQITAFTVLQKSFYIYAGDSFGNVSLFKLDLGQRCLVDLPYCIPFAESYGSTANGGNGVDVAFVSPQPLAESNRDGVMTLWDIKASRVVFVSGRTTQQQSHQEEKNVTSSCWACSKGSKVAIGYDSGDIYLWAIPDVLILNEESESRIVKMVLPITEACQGMEFVTGLSDPNKQRQTVLVLLLKSGQICLYDDSEIERYLLQSQSRSPPTLPSHSFVKQPYGDSGINVAKFYTSDRTATANEDYFSTLASKYPWLLSMKDKGQISASLSNIHKTRNLYITGHMDGTISFWDASCPLLLQIFMIKQQHEDNTSSRARITSLQFDMSSSILISGDQGGTVRVITFKKDSSDNILSILQGKQGDNYDARSIKLKGAVTSTSMISNSKHFAVGTEKGIVSVIKVDDATILYQKQLECRVSGGIASLQFELYSHNGYDKDLLIVGMEDSSICILEEETGKLLNANPVQTNRPTRALLLQTLELSPNEAPGSDNHDTALRESLLLLCTEDAIRLFSLSHAIQGMKKITNKKKLNGSCCFVSVIHGASSEIGIVLVFSNGKVETRSLPDLSLLKEASLRGFVHSKNLNSSSSITCSSDGEIILIKGEETYFFSTLCQDDIYRHVDNINMVYRKDHPLREESSYVVKSPKEKKKKQKGPHFAGLSKQKFSKGLQALRGKLKPRTEEKVNTENKKPEDEPSVRQVDQIKMKYGYATSDDSTSVPKMIGNKLQENIKKLEGINLRSADMAHGAQSFSSMAKELLRTTKNEKSSS
uniref:Lethal giant larvae (Lgl)-like C-terminal domain-containing protein n=1 Tax=Aegilops tauschii subsp. strangulata TaxID=200361 RepID=A0A453CMF3_AEGTS